MGLLFKEEKEREENTRTYIEKGTSMQGRKRGIKKRAIRQSCDTLMILFLTHFFFFSLFRRFYFSPLSSFVSFCDLFLRYYVTYRTLRYYSVFLARNFLPTSPFFFISPSRVCRVLLYRLTTVILCIVEINGGKENKNSTLFLLK